MPRKSFSIHSDYYGELCGLSAEQRGDVLLALIKWANDGEAPELDPICAMLFRLMKAQTERISTANSANGSRGGRGNKSEKSEESGNTEESEKSEEKPKKPTVSVTVTDTDSNTGTSNTPPTPPGGEGDVSTTAAQRKAELRAIRDSYTFSTPLNDSVNSWIRYKNNKRQKYEPEGFRNLLSTIRNRAEEYGDAAVIEVITESMAANYTGITWGKLSDRGGVGNATGNRGNIQTSGVPPGDTSGVRPVLGTVIG